MSPDPTSAPSLTGNTEKSNGKPGAARTIAHRRSSVVITVPDPDQMEPAFFVHSGATIQWRTETTHYPFFEVHFNGCDPCGGTDTKFPGSDVAPVVLKPTVDGDYECQIWHFKSPGKKGKKGPVQVFKVRTCNPCQP